MLDAIKNIIAEKRQRDLVEDLIRTLQRHKDVHPIMALDAIAFIVGMTITFSGTNENQIDDFLLSFAEEIKQKAVVLKKLIDSGLQL